MLRLCKSFQIYLLPRGVIPWKETWLCIFQHRKADSEEFLQLSPWQVSVHQRQPLSFCRRWKPGCAEVGVKRPLNVTEVWHFHDAESSGYKGDRAMSSGRCSAAGIRGWKLWWAARRKKDDIILSGAVSFLVSWCPARANIITSNLGVCHPNRREKFPRDRGDFIKWHSSAKPQDLQLSWQHLTRNEEGWWVYNGKMVLRILSCSPENTSGATQCLPNSKFGFLLPEKSELGKWAVPRSAGRELGFPSSCSSRTASKLFSSVELPVELTQLLSGKKQSEAQLTDHFPRLTQALFSACEVSAEPWELSLHYPRPSNGFIWSTQVGSTSTQIKSGLQRSHKKHGVWRLKAAWLPGIQQKSSLVLNTEPVCSLQDRMGLVFLIQHT